MFGWTSWIILIRLNYQVVHDYFIFFIFIIFYIDNICFCLMDYIQQIERKIISSIDNINLIKELLNKLIENTQE